MIVSAIILAAALIASALILKSSVKDIGASWGLGEQADFVPLDKLMAEEFPEQYTTLPGDLIFEEDFTLLD